MANNLTVDNQESFDQMGDLYSQAKSWEKRIDFLRKEANAPFQDKINGNNDKAKEYLSQTKHIEMMAKKKSSQYLEILEQKKREEEERAKEEAIVFDLKETASVQPLDKSIRGSSALLYTRTVRKFRIVDQSKVPAKYLKVDEDTVERDIKLGIGEIPGIEIYEEKVTQLRTR